MITEQPYIAQLIETMEAEGLRPLPIFINGVEAHTVVGGGAACVLWICCRAGAGGTTMVCKQLLCLVPVALPVLAGLRQVHLGTRAQASCKACARQLPPHAPLRPQVRDQLTTAHEQELLRAGGKTSPTLSRDAVLVDAVVNTGGRLEESGFVSPS